MKLTHYGTYYNGGKIHFFQTKKKIAFYYKNMITIIDLKLESVKTLNFYLRSKILAFDIDMCENIILTIDSSNLLVLVDIKSCKIISKMILQKSSSIIKISPMGKYFIIGNLNKIELWKFSCIQKNVYYNFQMSRTYNGNYSDISMVEWSDDGNYLITVSIDKTVKIFSFRKRNNFSQISINIFLKKVFLIKFFFNSRKFIVLSEKNVLTEWDFCYKKIKKFEKSSLTNKILNIKLSRVLFLSVKNSQILSSWMNSLSELLFIILTNGQISYFQIPKKAGIYRTNNLANLINKNILSQIKLFKIDPFDVSYLSGTLNDNLISIGKKKKKEILIIDWLKKKIIVKYQNLGEKITNIALSPNDKLACTCNSKRTVVIWSLVSGFSLIKFNNHVECINRIIFLEKNSRIILTSSADGTVKIYDLKKCTVTKSLDTVFPIKNFDALEVDNSGSFVASACANTFLIFIWSLKNGLIIEILNNHKSFVCDLFFTQKNIKIVTGSYDKSLILWHLDDRVYYKKNCSCEIIRTCVKIIAISRHPFKDQIAVLFDSYCISFFKIKKRLEIIGISIDIKKSIGKFSSNLILDNQISIGYSCDGNCFFIKDSKHQIFAFEIFPFRYISHHKIHSKHIKNKSFCNNTNKNGNLKLSRKKKFGVFHTYEGFFSFSFSEFKKKGFYLYHSHKTEILIKKKEWKNTFKWILSLKNSSFIDLLIEKLPLNVLNSFLECLFVSKNSYCEYRLIEYNKSKRPDLLKKYLSNYTDLVLILFDEFGKTNIDSKIIFFIKYLINFLTNIKVYMIYFISILKLPRF
jgi:WD40 repeat protein